MSFSLELFQVLIFVSLTGTSLAIVALITMLVIEYRRGKLW